MKNDPTKVLYPGIQAKVQEFLRQRGDGGINTTIVTDSIKANRTTVSSVMAVLARTTDTGVSHVSAGLYRYTRALDREYVARMKRDGIDVPQPGAGTNDPALKVTHPLRPTPAVLPQRRTYPGEPVVVVSARHAEEEASVPESGLTRAGTVRQRRPMQRDVGLRALRFLQKPGNKGEIFSIGEVAEGIDALPSSVSVVLRNFAGDSRFPVEKIMPGTLYTVPLSAAEQAERDHAEQAVRDEAPQPAVAEPEPAAPAPAPAPEPEPVQPPPAPEPAPESAASKADDNMVLLERLYEVEPGKWLTKDVDGNFRWLEDLK